MLTAALIAFAVWVALGGRPWRRLLAAEVANGGHYTRRLAAQPLWVSLPVVSVVCALGGPLLWLLARRARQYARQVSA